ncbi:MAG: TetR/AcrR family transcriptional regulator [Gemmatimonadetes bacterium]|nr:TetR/AcrR family transcriptional regulator [Gemmatimonadota bacterium]
MPDGPAGPALTRRRAPRGRGAELRGDVLAAAMDLLAETGDEQAVSVRAVAQRVGVSAPSIYLHFADKQALLDAVCEEVFEALHLRLRAAAKGADNPFEALRAQGNAYVHFALENPEHYRLVMMTKHAPGDKPSDQLIARGAFGYLVESVRRCVQEGVYAGDPVELALGLWAAAHGVAALLVAKPYFPWPDRDAFIDRTICMAGLGLAVGERLSCEGSVPLPDLVAVLDSLGGPADPR